MSLPIEKTKVAPAIMRLKEAAEYLQISLPTIFRLSQNDPTFPKKIQISKRVVGHLKVDIDNWLQTKYQK